MEISLLIRRSIPLLLLLALARPGFAQQAPKKVLVFVGMPGAGKSTAAQRLASKLGAPTLSSGDVIRNTISERGLEYNKENDRAVAEEFAKKPGEIGRRMADQIAKASSELVIVEGFRTKVDLAEVQKAYPNTLVVAVEVGPKRRYARMLGRGRSGEDTVEYLKNRDRNEIRRGVREVMRAATLRIRPRGDNMDSLDRSLTGVENLLNEKK